MHLLAIPYPSLFISFVMILTINLLLDFCFVFTVKMEDPRAFMP
jgi:hypothetical protein